MFDYIREGNVIFIIVDLNNYKEVCDTIRKLTASADNFPDQVNLFRHFFFNRIVDRPYSEDICLILDFLGSLEQEIDLEPFTDLPLDGIYLTDVNVKDAKLKPLRNFQIIGFYDVAKIDTLNDLKEAREIRIEDTAGEELEACNENYKIVKRLELHNVEYISITTDEGTTIWNNGKINSRAALQGRWVELFLV